jgi:hypothetical protein
MRMDSQVKRAVRGRLDVQATNEPGAGTARPRQVFEDERSPHRLMLRISLLMPGTLQPIH